MKVSRYHLPDYGQHLWFILGIAAVLAQLMKGSFNNYLIYEGVFRHTIQQKDLFAGYPAEYGDCNHYGPVFSLIVAPFALLPNYIGCFFWGLTNVFLLWKAIIQLPLKKTSKNCILLLSALELMTAMHNLQFNVMLTAFILWAYILVQQKKDFWATLFIALGILTKIYGVVGLVFFFFSTDKLKFATSFAMWMIILFCLPMLISSPQYIVSQYESWFYSLASKNGENIISDRQDMSVMRIIRKITGSAGYIDKYILTAAAVTYLITISRWKQWINDNFQLHYVAFLLIGLVIFSTGAESPTYIIAVTGVAIWYVQQPRKFINLAILFFILVFTCLSTTDLFPAHIKRDWIRPYAIKAFPCLIVWCILCAQLLLKNFSQKNT